MHSLASLKGILQIGSNFMFLAKHARISLASGRESFGCKLLTLDVNLVSSNLVISLKHLSLTAYWRIVLL